MIVHCKRACSFGGRDSVIEAPSWARGWTMKTRVIIETTTSTHCLYYAERRLVELFKSHVSPARWTIPPISYSRLVNSRHFCSSKIKFNFLQLWCLGIISFLSVKLQNCCFETNNRGRVHGIETKSGVIICKYDYFILL